MTITDKQKLFMVCNNYLSPYMIAEYELFFYGQLLIKVTLTNLTFNIICLL